MYRIKHTMFTIGWWYASSLEDGSEGWLPSTVLEPRRASLRQYKDYDKIYQPIEGSIDFLKPVPFYVKKSYRANQTDEISLESGEWVHVLHQSYSGWWTVKYESHNINGETNRHNGDRQR